MSLAGPPRLSCARSRRYVCPVPIRRSFRLARRLAALSLASSLLVPVARAQRPNPAPKPVERPAQHGGTVVDIRFWSQMLGTTKHARVYLPPSYATGTKRYPVAYYLHGASGSEADWSTQGRLGATMDSLISTGMPELIVVMPDGDDGWYTTWNALGNYSECTRNPPKKESAADYCVPWPKYDDYIARDVVAHIDSTYRTVADRAHRGIAGLSMGGYGAVSLALGYPDVFSAAASHSGVLAPLRGIAHDSVPAPARDAQDIDEVKARWPQWLWPSLALAFGGRDMFGWYSREPLRMADRAIDSGRPLPPLYVDCGIGDPFLPENREFVAGAKALGERVEYHEYPGGHSWDYWRAHLPQSLVWIAGQIGRPQ
jgi:S-formylglutathione hydrolase FrmB